MLARVVLRERELESAERHTRRRCLRHRLQPAEAAPFDEAEHPIRAARIGYRRGAVVRANERRCQSRHRALHRRDDARGIGGDARRVCEHERIDPLQHIPLAAIGMNEPRIVDVAAAMSVAANRRAGDRESPGNRQQRVWLHH